MKRTIGTICTGKGIARIEHDSQTKDLIGVFADGSIEAIGDYHPTKSWVEARKQIAAMYGARSNAYHDPWVLCLRPIHRLKIARTENHQKDQGNG